MIDEERITAIAADLIEAARLMRAGKKGALVLIQTARYTLADIEYSLRPQAPAMVKPLEDDDPAVEIPICGGNVALVSAIDEARMLAHSWSMHDGGYTATSINGKNITMHRLIMQPPPRMWVDHINGNKLDNRRSNLRIVTPAQNRANTGTQGRATHGYKGVSFDPKFKRKYGARIVHEGKIHILGRYNTPEDAARAYNAAARELHGEYAFQNVILG